MKRPPFPPKAETLRKKSSAGAAEEEIGVARSLGLFSSFWSSKRSKKRSKRLYSPWSFFPQNSSFGLVRGSFDPQLDGPSEDMSAPG